MTFFVLLWETFCFWNHIEICSATACRQNLQTSLPLAASGFFKLNEICTPTLCPQVRHVNPMLVFNQTWIVVGEDLYKGMYLSDEIISKLKCFPLYFIFFHKINKMINKGKAKRPKININNPIYPTAQSDKWPSYLFEETSRPRPSNAGWLWPGLWPGQGGHSVPGTWAGLSPIRQVVISPQQLLLLCRGSEVTQKSQASTCTLLTNHSCLNDFRSSQYYYYCWHSLKHLILI